MTYYKEFISGYLVLPKEILNKFDSLFRSADDFLVWLYFFNDKEVAPSLIAQQMGKSLQEINKSIQRMQADNLLKITLLEINGQTEMMVDISSTFKMLDELNQVNQEKKEDNSLQKLAKSFEAEMGMISPIQIEEIKNWLEIDQYSSDLIFLALKEASLNKKLSFKYIQAILKNWKSEGILTKAAVEEKKKERELSYQLKNNNDDVYSTSNERSFTIPIEGPWS
ncbi:MAG: DnaD domain-containing protein [Lactovum sp.]